MASLVKEQDLKKMGRSELLEILLLQNRKLDELNQENQQLRQELDAAREQLRSRRIDLVDAGSIAEAALRLNGVFEAAQAACQQYVENVKRRVDENQEIRFPESAPEPVEPVMVPVEVPVPEPEPSGDAVTRVTVKKDTLLDKFRNFWS